MLTHSCLPLLFYIITAANSQYRLQLSIQLNNYISENNYIQHIIGFATLFILITLNNKLSTQHALLYTSICYIWFILSTKLDLHWNIIIIVLLFIGYIIENNNKIFFDDIQNDNALTQEQKNMLINNKNTNKLYFMACILSITIMGTILYNQKKHIQYGDKYDNLIYFFGK